MAIVQSGDILISSIYIILAVLQFTTAYYASAFFTVEAKIRTLFGVSSPFLFILAGFPFKLFGQLKLYFFLQILVFSFLVLLFLKKLYSGLHLYFIKKIYFGYFLILLFLIHFFSFESRNFYTYGFSDMTDTHIQIERVIFESFTGYQPGMGIYLSPVYFITNPKGSLDYLGFSIGLVLLILTLVLLEQIKPRLSFYFLPLFTLPFFIENQKFLIGFSNNQFFTLFIPLFIALIYFMVNEQKSKKLILFLLGSVLASITITNPAVTLSTGILFILLIIILPRIFNYQISELFFSFIFFIVGIFLYLFNSNLYGIKLLNFLQQYTFNPQIFSRDSILYNSLFFIWEIVKFKVIVNPFSSFFNFSGYIALLSMITICILAILRKNFLIFLFSFSATILGFSTLTGAGQYSFIMGRAGWYFILLFLITIALLAHDIFLSLNFSSILFLAYSLIIIFNASNPPSEYRYDNEEIHLEIYRYSINQTSDLYLYSTLQDNRIYVYNEKNITLIDDLTKYIKVCSLSDCNLIVAIDKSKKSPDPILSREIDKELIQNQDIIDAFYQRRQVILNSNLNLEKELLKEGFKIYFENESSSLLVKF